jgi:NAD(P)-dependent dehydrogenase (short-subunit alcohol dehydrogenase family)
VHHVRVNRSPRWTEQDVPDLAGRVALVTGANSGIGYETARVFAEHGAHVVLGCRNPDRAADAARRIDDREPRGSVEVLRLDLADLDSVTTASSAFCAEHSRLDLLVNNAGLMCTPRGVTAQGFETQFGVNHLGHFALTASLLPTLLDTEGSRVVTVSSLSHHFARVGVDEVDELVSPRRYSPLGAYCGSKLANLLFTFELQARLAVVEAPTIAVAAHPGGANTNLGRENPGGPFFTLVSWMRPYVEGFTQSPQIGALATLRAATDSAADGGSFFGPDGLLQIWGHPIRVGPSRRARDRELAARLWNTSVAATGRRPLSAHE